MGQADVQLDRCLRFQVRYSKCLSTAEEKKGSETFLKERIGKEEIDGMKNKEREGGNKTRGRRKEGDKQ